MIFNQPMVLRPRVVGLLKGGQKWHQICCTSPRLRDIVKTLLFSFLVKFDFWSVNGVEAKGCGVIKRGPKTASDLLYEPRFWRYCQKIAFSIILLNWDFTEITFYASSSILFNFYYRLYMTKCHFIPFSVISSSWDFAENHFLASFLIQGNFY